MDTRTARVLLVEATGRVLGAFPPSLSASGERQLRSLGVTPLLETTVVGIDAESVEVEAPDGARSRIAARTVVWAAGVTASPLARAARDGDRDRDRPRRPAHRRARPDPAGAPRGVRARRHGHRARSATARRRAGRDAAGPPRRPLDRRRARVSRSATTTRESSRRSAARARSASSTASASAGSSPGCCGSASTSRISSASRTGCSS